jgi:hypothetical protein
MRLPGAHLTYCTNIHPGGSWDETFAQLERHLPAVKARACPDERMGVGLRLSGSAAGELAASGLAKFDEWLATHDLYVFTINGFVVGRFHDVGVKASVYEPDWTDPERVAYTHTLAEILETLLPPAEHGSISTVPGGFGRDRRNDWARMGANVLRAAADLWRRAERSGTVLRLALEPEPMCTIETTAEAIEWFETALLSRTAVASFSRATGVTESVAEAAIRRHVGICLDTCHAAVEFEDPVGCVDRILAAGIGIPKLQATTGLEVDPRRPGAIEALAAFADDVYLHQVVVEGDSGLQRFVDLPEALAAAHAGDLAGRRWRVHFHVPVFRETLPPFVNTQPFLRACLSHARAVSASAHLEVETYTWDVLPPVHRTGSVDDAIARELRWVAESWGR